jgi:hypothetical protein
MTDNPWAKYPHLQCACEWLREPKRGRTKEGHLVCLTCHFYLMQDNENPSCPCCGKETVAPMVTVKPHMASPTYGSVGINEIGSSYQNKLIRFEFQKVCKRCANPDVESEEAGQKEFCIRCKKKKSSFNKDMYCHACQHHIRRRQNKMGGLYCYECMATLPEGTWGNYCSKHKHKMKEPRPEAVVLKGHEGVPLLSSSRPGRTDNLASMTEEAAIRERKARRVVRDLEDTIEYMKGSMGAAKDYQRKQKGKLPKFEVDLIRKEVKWTEEALVALRVELERQKGLLKGYLTVGKRISEVRSDKLSDNVIKEAK